MASYFPEAGNLNGINADMCSDVAGPSSSGSGDLLNFQIGQIKLIPYYKSICPSTTTSGRHLGFVRDYSHLA